MLEQPSTGRAVYWKGPFLEEPCIGHTPRGSRRVNPSPAAPSGTCLPATESPLFYTHTHTQQPFMRRAVYWNSHLLTGPCIGRAVYWTPPERLLARESQPRRPERYVPPCYRGTSPIRKAHPPTMPSGTCLPVNESRLSEQPIMGAAIYWRSRVLEEPFNGRAVYWNSHILDRRLKIPPHQPQPCCSERHMPPCQ